MDKIKYLEFRTPGKVHRVGVFLVSLRTLQALGDDFWWGRIINRPEFGAWHGRLLWFAYGFKRRGAV